MTLERMNTTTSNAESAGVVAPAPVFFVIATLVGTGLEWLKPSALLAQPYALVVGASLIAVSIILVASVLAQMARARTPFDARKPTSALITSGVFRVSRNPTYLSLVLLQAGLAVAFQSLWLLFLVLPAAAATHWGVILREERYLQKKFGSGYSQYASSVRRWL
jgi:protein-S-isoprenylcysteine O-methyltransferase Ste14